MTITVACLAHPREKQRWLPSLADHWSTFGQVQIVWDDEGEMWGNEAEWRAHLWDIAVGTTAVGDWILVLDADMIPANDPTPLMEQIPSDVNSTAFYLYDLWGRHPWTYRTDGFWKAHQVARVWAVRNPGPSFVVDWPGRSIHNGHFPPNLPTGRGIVAPQPFSLMHLAYVRPEDRQAKLAQYMQVRSSLSDFEYNHALSIADDQPKVARLPFDIQWDIQHHEDIA